MTPRFHPYAPLAVAIVLGAASLAAAYASVGAASPGMAAVSITGDDTNVAAVPPADGAGARPDQLAYLHIDGTRVWVDFAPQESAATPLPASRAGLGANALVPARAGTSGAMAEKPEAPVDAHGGMAS